MSRLKPGGNPAIRPQFLLSSALTFFVLSGSPAGQSYASEQATSPQITSDQMPKASTSASIIDDVISVTEESVSSLNSAINKAIDSNSSCINGCVIDIRDQKWFVLNDTLNELGTIDKPVWFLGNPDDSDSHSRINGNHDYQIAFVDNTGDGFYSFFGIDLQNGLAQGGNGATGGGGGMGAGGAMFINNGFVIFEHSFLTNNSAVSGTSPNPAGSGGDHKSSGKNGGKGGRINDNSRFWPDDSSPGDGGAGNGICEGGSSSTCTVYEDNRGKAGGFGSGGGGGGGGGGDHNNSDGGDRGGDGAPGGNGGFGAGGGGGGADDAGEANGPEEGDGGEGAPSIQFGTYGNTGDDGYKSSGGQGGTGGKGAGFGGAIFVRSDNNQSKLKLNNTVLNNNNASGSPVSSNYKKGLSIYEWKGSCDNDDDCNSNGVASKDNSSYPTQFLSKDIVNKDYPTLSLKLNNKLDSTDDNHSTVLEGERAQLMIEFDRAPDSSDLTVYLFLSDNDARATYGTDFAWGSSSRIMALTISQSDINDGKYFISIPETPSHNQGAYVGIQTYLDKHLEGDEEFSVQILPGPEYYLDDTKYKKEITIKDANYQVEILEGGTSERTTICDVSDALETADSSCSTGHVNDEINVDELAGLGYITVQAKRPLVPLKNRSGGDAHTNWANTEGEYSSVIIGGLFNNALAGGLPVHYKLSSKPNDVFLNQVNYNNKKYNDSPTTSADSHVDSDDYAQIYNAVVIPVTSLESTLDGEQPGTARIWFSALPDAVFEQPDQNFKLTLIPFENDPSYDEDAFCNNENQSYCDALFNNPDGDFQFYSVHPSKNYAEITVEDSGEFQPKLIIIDNINGEEVDDNDTDSNPLLADKNRDLHFWVRLGSQPTQTVSVNVTGNTTLNFNPSNWSMFQPVTVENANLASGINVESESSDNNYASLERTLYPIEDFHRLKIKEASITDTRERTIELGITPSFDRYQEGSLQYPAYRLILGQPLPIPLKATVNTELSGSTDSYTVTIPAWHQAAEFTVPVKDDDIANNQRTLSATIDTVTDATGTPLNNLVINSTAQQADITIIDNDRATILISQHLPDKPTDGDIARLYPEIEVLGIANDNLIVQHNDSRIESLSVTKVGQTKTGTNNNEQHGLLYETFKQEAVETDFTYKPFITYEDRPYLTEVNQSTDAFDITGFAEGIAIRQRGYITVAQTGYYQFNTNPTEQYYEFWLNSADDYSQNIEFLAPQITRDEQNNGYTVDELHSQEIYLKSGTRYYLETRYQAFKGDAGGSFSLTYRYKSEPGETPTAWTNIPQNWLEPAPVSNGFVVENFDAKGKESLDAFINSNGFDNKVESSSILTNSLQIPAEDAAEDIARRVSVTLTAPESGEYRFALASDGDSKLYLSKKGEPLNEIAWITGSEQYGTYTITTSTNSGHANTTNVTLELQKFDAASGWGFNYEMKDGTVSKPYGDAGKLTLWDGSQQICTDTQRFVTSNYVVNDTNQQTEEGVTANFFGIGDPEDCHPMYNNYDGTSITINYHDYGGSSLESDDFINIRLNDFSLEHPDYPAPLDWYWDNIESNTDIQGDNDLTGRLNSEQQSQSIYLEKGQQYTIQVLQLNVRDDDHLAVGWLTPFNSDFEVMDAAHLSISEFDVPVTLTASGETTGSGADTSINLAMTSTTFSYMGEDYYIDALTLAGSEDPYVQPGLLSFGSGFIAKNNVATTLTSNATPTLVTPQDRVDEPGTVSLTVGQQKRLGFQLKGKPGAPITIDLSESSTAPVTKTSDSASSPSVAYSCDAEEGISCQSMTFTQENWNTPQFVTVLATQEGTDIDGNYDPENSFIYLTASQRTSARASVDYLQDTVTIAIYPDNVEATATYFAKAGQSTGINSIALSTTDQSEIFVYRHTTSPAPTNERLSWDWVAYDNGRVIQATQNGEILLTASIYQDTLPTIEPGDEPASLRSSVQLHAPYFEQSSFDAFADQIAISGFTVLINGNDHNAFFEIMINQGTPEVKLISSTAGADFSLEDIQFITYQPNGTAPPVTTAVDETMVTEYGELTLTRQTDTPVWVYYANPRPQPAKLTFTLTNTSGETFERELNLQHLTDAPSIATSLTASADYTTPLIKLNSHQEINEDDISGAIQVDFKLRDPVTEKSTTYDHDIQVFYTVHQQGLNSPGYSALDLSSSTTPEYYLVPESPVIITDNKRNTFTLEVWIQPSDLVTTQTILEGKIGNDEKQPLLSLDNKEITTAFGLNTLPAPWDTSNNNIQGVLVSWRVTEDKETLFINGIPVGEKAISSDQDRQLVLSSVSNASQGFNGFIDELRIWKTLRTDSDIAQNYQTTLNFSNQGESSALVAYWPFNQFDIHDQVDPNSTSYLLSNTCDLASPDESACQPVLATQPSYWRIQQSATVGEDVTAMTQFTAPESTHQSLNDRTTTGRRTFAVAQLNADKLQDLLIVDDTGRVSLHLTTPEGDYRHIETSVNLTHAAPITLLDINNDKQFDLIAGLKDGQLGVALNTGSVNEPRFAALRTIDVSHPALSTQQQLTPAVFNGQLIVANKKGELASFTSHVKRDNISFKPLKIAGLNTVKLHRSGNKPGDNELSGNGLGIVPQFVDLDRDGDKDLIIDQLRNLPAQQPGFLRYYENVGTDDAPRYRHAPNNYIARHFQHIDQYLDEKLHTRTRTRHPYDQMEFHQIVDFNNDGMEDLVFSDNQGQIRVMNSLGYGSVTIPANSSSASLTVNIVNDDIVETNEVLNIQLIEGLSAEAKYHFRPGSDIATITITDDDQPGFTVKKGSTTIADSITVSESNPDAEEYTIQLQSQPTEAVIVRIGSSNPTYGATVSLAEMDGFTDTIEMRFSAEGNSWNTPKSFWIKATDDQVDEDDSSSYALAIAGVSADQTYNKLIKPIVVNNTGDNDEATLDITYSPLPVVGQPAGSTTEGEINALTISLNAQPTEPLSVTVAPQDNEITLFPQRKLVKSLSMHAATNHINNVTRFTDKSVTTECSTQDDSTNDGVLAMGKYGIVCWNQDGDYRYQQTQFSHSADAQESLSFVIDNSYGRLGTETLNIPVTSLQKVNDKPTILLVDQIAGKAIPNKDLSKVLLEDGTIRFALRPSTPPTEQEYINITVALGSKKHFIFDHSNWNSWQTYTAENVAEDETAVISAYESDMPAASPKNARADIDYAEPREVITNNYSDDALEIVDITAGVPVINDGFHNNVFATNLDNVKLKLRLTTQPFNDVTVDIEGELLTFTSQNYREWQFVAINTQDFDQDRLIIQTNGYVQDRILRIIKQPLTEQQDNFFNQVNSLAGQQLTIQFTPDDWNLARTIGVAAVDDDKVEYNHISKIDLLYADPGQSVTTDFGSLSWQPDGTIRYEILRPLTDGFHAEQRLWYTIADGIYKNYNLDITVDVVSEVTVEGGEDETDTIETTYTVNGYLNRPICVHAETGCENITSPDITFSAVTGSGTRFTSEITGVSDSEPLTSVSRGKLDPAYLNNPVAPLEVSIEDNDSPIVRAGVDLDAVENTHPGYFTLYVDDPVGIPGGIGINYTIYGANDAETWGTTAETEPPAAGELADPGPDFQGYDTLGSGKVYIPENKTRVSLPIFPIDDFTPEESLAARYEKVVIVIEEPDTADGYGGDRYVLDTQYPEYQSAGVRIIDNEEVGLKYVMPLDGLVVDEGSFNGFRVGLKSQPQTKVDLTFYGTPVTTLEGPDNSFVQVSSVSFDNTDWNQWKTINVEVYNNQAENDDRQSPRISDLYYTLLDNSDTCDDDPTKAENCEPFYNTMKGAVNLTVPDTEDGESTVELNPDWTFSPTSISGEYGKLTFTKIKGTNQFAGDFVYQLNNGEFNTSNKTEEILEDISQRPDRTVIDIFDYTMEDINGDSYNQQVAVHIKALEQVTLSEGSTFPQGNYGELTVNPSLNYTYLFDPEELVFNAEDNWQFTDSFVYQLQAKAGTGSDDDTVIENMTANITVTKTTNDAGDVVYSASMNGNNPTLCGSATVCSSNSSLQVTGSLMPQTIGGNADGDSVTFTILKTGKPVTKPVVTTMNLLDSNGETLWVDNARLMTNPLFTTNAINSRQRFVKTGNDIQGKHGTFTVNADGSYEYNLDADAIFNTMATTDIRIVSDQFQLHLTGEFTDPDTDQSEVTHPVVTLDIVSIVQQDHNHQRVTVMANGDTLQQDSATSNTFTGQLFFDNAGLTVNRAGRTSRSVVIREPAMDPRVLADGLTAAFDFLQKRFYDTSVPVFGRMGGRATTDTTGDNTDTNAPGFFDRFSNIVESQIIKQPHLTTAELATLINVTLQSTFAQFNVPLQVLKVDSEKMVMRLSYTAGVSSATDEFQSDWGMSGMGHFRGSAAGTFKFTADLYFGVKFRNLVKEDGKSKLRQSVFVVTDKEVLKDLMGDPGVEPVEVYKLKTWEGATVAQSGVLFVDNNGYAPEFDATKVGAEETGEINAQLDSPSDGDDINPQIKWRWARENPSMNWNFNVPAITDINGTANKNDDYGTLLGVITDTDEDKTFELPFLAISLRQPTSIGPAQISSIEITATPDPMHILKSNRGSEQWKKEYLEIVFDEIKGETLTFNNRYIKAFDVSTENNFNDPGYEHDPAQMRKLKTLKESQPLELDFNITLREEASSDPIGFQQSTWVAETKVERAIPSRDIDADRRLLMVDSTYDNTADPTKDELTVACKNSTSTNRCEPYKLTVKAEWSNDKYEVRKFPADLSVFKDKETWSQTLQLKEGKLKISGRYKNSKVTWKWKFSSLPSKELNFTGDKSTIDVENIIIGSDKPGIGDQDAKYTITKNSMLFIGKPEETDSKQANAISKLTLDLYGSLDFRGDAQLFALGASINQAPTVPMNTKDETLTQPEEIFGKLIGSYSARDTIAEVTDDNPDESSPAFMVGSYGILGIAQDGSYSYSLKPELLEDSLAITCNKMEEIPTTPYEANDQALCRSLLATNDDAEEDEDIAAIDKDYIHFPDPDALENIISLNGYEFTCPSLADVLDGVSCESPSPNVLLNPQTYRDLTVDGVPSLESTLASFSEDIEGWQDTGNLSNQASLKSLYDNVNNGIDNYVDEWVIYGITELKDVFQVSVSNDVSFRPLAITIKDNQTFVATFNDVDYDALSAENFPPPEEQVIADQPGWYGGHLSYHEPGIGDVVQIASGKIQSMAEANVYLDIALVDSEEGDTKGILYVPDFRKPMNLVQFTLGGNAAVYAQVNAAVGLQPTVEDEEKDSHGFELPGPSVVANVGLTAHYSGTASVSDTSTRGGEFVFGIYDLGLDLGSYISDKLVEPLSHLDNEMGPIYPVAKALTTDMKIFETLNLVPFFDLNHDGIVTALEIPTPFLRAGGPKTEKYEKQLRGVDKFMEFIAGIAQMIMVAVDLGNELAAVDELKERVISTDGFQVSPADIRINPYQSHSDLTGISTNLVPYVNQLGHIILGSDKSFQFVKTLDGHVNSRTVTPMEPKKTEGSNSTSSKNKSMSTVKKHYTDLQKRGIVSFPVLSNPMDVLKYFFGDPADLIIIDPPDFEIEFELEKTFKVPGVPFFRGLIAGELSAGTDIVLGVDTGGILQTVCGNDSPQAIWKCQGELAEGDRAIRMLNSIFIRDWSEQSYMAGGDSSADKLFYTGTADDLSDKTVWDKHELWGNAEIDIGAGVDLGVFSSYFQGGPGLGGGVDLIDICELTTPGECESIENGDFTAGGSYDGKLRAYDFGMQLVNNPGSVFDVGFTFYVDLEAFIETFKIKVWEELIGYFPLYEFGHDALEASTNTRAADGSVIAGATVYFDANGNGQADAGEPLSFSNHEGRATLRIPYRFFDINRDGKIDDIDGKVRFYGGMNTQTGKGMAGQMTISALH